MLKKIEKILAQVKPYTPEHHLGLPFLSAYQIAIEVEAKHPDDAATIQSLPSYIAKFLSQAIKNGECPNIEGGFISHSHLKSMDFVGDYQISEQGSHSIFRFIGK